MILNRRRQMLWTFWRNLILNIIWKIYKNYFKIINSGGLFHRNKIFSKIQFYNNILINTRSVETLKTKILERNSTPKVYCMLLVSNRNYNYNN